MTEGLSTAASVITVAACATESAKFLFKAFREASLIPKNVHQVLSALTSLNTALIGIQQCGSKLDPKWQFPKHFCQRLFECRTQLKEWSDKLAKIDSLLQHRQEADNRWKGRSRRSWQKIKWLAGGEQGLRQFLEIIKLYHAEFSLQLLIILITLQDSNSPRQISDGSNPDQPSSTGSAEESPRGPLSQTVVVKDVPKAGPARDPQGQNKQEPRKTTLTPSMGLPEASPVQRQENLCLSSEHEGRMPEKISGPCVERLFTPHHKICTRTTLRFNFTFLDCMIRLGPVRIIQQPNSQAGHLVPNNRNLGFGIGISLSLASQSSRRFCCELLVLFLSMFQSFTFNFVSSLDCVRVVPQHAGIFEAVRVGSIERVKQLFANGQASIRDVTTHDLSLLHTASGLGLIDLVRFLIEAGSDVNASDEDGETPLHRATSRKDNYDVARLLIENGADIASVDVGNRTVLHAIFNNTIGGILSSSNVLEHTSSDSGGMSISHFLAWSRHTTPEDFERGRIHDAAELWSTDSSGKSCLHYAALKGNIGLLTHLLNRASPLELEDRDISGQTPLHCAARSSRAVQLIGLLLAKGARVDACDASGHSLLDHAAKWGKREAVQQLLAPKSEQQPPLID